MKGILGAAVVINQIGRRNSLFLFLTVCGTASLLLLPQQLLFASSFLLYICRAFITGSFCTLYTYTPEAFPTIVRMTAVGFLSAFSRIGAAGWSISLCISTCSYPYIVTYTPSHPHILCDNDDPNIMKNCKKEAHIHIYPYAYIERGKEKRSSSTHRQK